MTSTSACDAAESSVASDAARTTDRIVNSATCAVMSMVIERARLGSCASRRSSTTASPVTSSSIPLVCPAMDVDAFVAAHAGEWNRLESLLARRGSLSGAEVDELVELYQRTATHLSTVRSATPDPALVSRLSSLVARGRSTVTGANTGAWRDVRRFVAVSFPVAVYRMRWWWLTTGAVFILVSFAVGWWVATHPEVQASIASPEQIRQLVDTDFENYYSSRPAGSFAFRVWTNNVWVAALSLVFGGLLGLPVVYLLWQNASNVGISGGLMAANGKADLFFGLIL